MFDKLETVRDILAHTSQRVDNLGVP